LLEKRVSPALAGEAYQEDPLSIEKRKEQAAALRLQPTPIRTHCGRPDKKARRQIERLRYAETGN